MGPRNREFGIVVDSKVEGIRTIELDEGLTTLFQLLPSYIGVHDID